MNAVIQSTVVGKQIRVVIIVHLRVPAALQVDVADQYVCITLPMELALYIKLITETNMTRTDFPIQQKVIKY